MRLRIQSQRGSALLITLTIMVLLTIAALTAVDTATTDINLSFNQFHADQAFYIAGAGIERAHATRNADTTWRVGFDTTSFGDGEYWVIVVDSVNDSSLFDTMLVFSFARTHDAKAIIEATLVPEWRYPYRWAMFGDDGVWVENHVTTDSYNSDSGSYASTVLNEYGSIGANGPITLQNNPTIGGNVQTSTPGGLSLAGGTIQGDTTSTADPESFTDLLNPADFAWAEANTSAPAGISGSFSYDPALENLTLSGSDTAFLASGTYYFNDLKLNQQASLQILPGASVEMYVVGDIALRNSAALNLGGRPINCRIYSTGSSLVLDQSSSMTAVVVATNVDFSLANYGDFYGSFIANSLHLSNNPRFHYDRSLYNIREGTTGRMNMYAWRELDAVF